MCVDADDRLPHIHVPTLLLRAKHDRLLRPGASRQLLSGIAHAREIAFDGPHLLLQTRIEHCAPAVAAFVREVCRADLKPPAASSDRPDRR
jgi:pimeloyl-ACP methyl ester carboxylesterase